MPNPKTNIEQVTDFMRFGSPMNQIFVMTALEKYADHLKNLTDTELDEMSGLINMHALKRSAVDWLDRKRK